MNGHSCCIIGQGKLTLSCARLLLAQNWRIGAIVSSNKEVLEWARSEAIATAAPADQTAFLAQYDFDYLFSIINPNKVSAALLKQARCAAINFHDAPLPRYAGLHVTSWALVNRESSFGVTWHEMTEDFDAGDILRQVEFPIDPDDTAFSLNVKCFQHGEQQFQMLVNDLAKGQINRTPQDLSLRSTFLASKRPDAAGLLDWTVDAEATEAAVRALSYQPDSNPIGMAKVLIANRCYLVLEATVLAETAAAGRGGVVQRIDDGSGDVNTDGIVDEGIVVSTASHCLRLQSFSRPDGTALDIKALVAETKLAVGDQFTPLTQQQRQQIHDLDHRYGKRERYWLNQLAQADSYADHTRIAQAQPNPEARLDCQFLESGLSQTLLEQLLALLPSNTIDTAQAQAEVSGPQSPVSQVLAQLCTALLACFFARLNDAADVSLSDHFAIAIDADSTLNGQDTLGSLFETRLPFCGSVDKAADVKSTLHKLMADYVELQANGSYSCDLFARWPELRRPRLAVGTAIANETAASSADEVLTLVLAGEGKPVQWRFNAASLSLDAVRQISQSFEVFVSQLLTDIEQPLSAIALVDAQQRQQLLVDWNRTEKDFDQSRCIHQLVEGCADQSPDAIALAFRDSQISYADLNQRANIVAHQLQRFGAKPDTRIGLFIDRSIEMVVGLLAILKSGAAYVPLDPAYPRDRIALMIDDANAPILLTVSKLAAELPNHNAEVLFVDQLLNKTTERIDKGPVVSELSPRHLAYVIYTSGSTGKPKGVMVEHRNVYNFFAGMDDTLDYDGTPGVWLAVTSISFDISVLEIFWSLSRGFKVVIQEQEARTLAQDAVSTVARKLDVGLFYFSSDAGPSENTQRYKLLLEGAKFADSHQFSAVWTPERHFHLFGGLYPNPSVTSAAIAAVTENIAIRAGSIVMPLHNPIRVAEEWSVVDNLSGGRVGFSFASGWHANDFSLLPENYQRRKEIMYEGIETVRKLWSGQEVTLANGEGKPFTARIYPEPVQKQPSMWITTAGNIDSFRAAGEGGFNVLTNLLGQNIEDIKEKIAAYRQGRREKGHKGEGQVAVMVHTFVGDDVEKVREIVRGPFSEYLKTSFDLVKIAPWAFPAFRQPSKTAAQDSNFDPDTLTDEDLDALLDHAFERYFETAGIFGTPASCIPLIDQLKLAGVDEVACLIDFGVDDELVLESLQYLDQLRKLANPVASLAVDDSAQAGSVNDETDFSIAAQLRRHQVTHFQCTPSMARILSTDPDTLTAWSKVQKTLLGGEALPGDLAQLLAGVCQGEIINVYGPTETTIWSTSARIASDGKDVCIGRPIANTQIYILDQQLQPVPVGTAGELYIGGAGVVRGYLDRPALTAERFIPNPFIEQQAKGSDQRLYRTGDLVEYRANGEINYLGRLDHQVKLRGYRIELGEIESLICANPAVNDCVVVAPVQDSGAQQLLAYLVTDTQGELGQQQSVSSWQSIWDETYQAGSDEALSQADNRGFDPMFNISGWLDSYTGQPHSDATMREWIDATAARILALKPRRVLELGCGTGLVLYRVAPQCEHYVGVDLSDHALTLITDQAQRMDWDHLRLLQGAANSDDVYQQLADEAPFDLVIINSVVQYFPNANYLAEVIALATQSLSANGQLFIGDVRSRALLDTFHHAIGLSRSNLADASGALPLVQLQSRIEALANNESELVIAPEFFYALQQRVPNIGSVDIQLKRGEQHNEMSAYRYDVTLTMGDPDAVLTREDFTTLEAPISMQSFEILMQHQTGPFACYDLSNSRVTGAIYARAAMRQLMASDRSATLKQLNARVDAYAPTGIDPEQFHRFNQQWRIVLAWARSGDAAKFDAYFIPVADRRILDLTLQAGSEDLSIYCHEPAIVLDSLGLVDQLKEQLRAKLPEFMLPDHFITLDALPLTPNGKIDRNALPAPEKRQRKVEEDFVAPQGDLEQTIAQVLQEMLNLEKIGTKDNFFNLGANSLLIVQANSRLSLRLKRKVSLVSMYRYPTVASLAEHLSGQADQKQGLEEGQKRGEKRKAAQANRRRRASSRRG